MPGPADQDDWPAGLTDFATPSGEIIGREQLARLERALHELPDDSREVIVLRRIVGLGYAEIAEHQGKTELAVRKLFSRASARLLMILDS